MSRQFQNPIVSIITPAYNSSKFIQETIDSIQSQTFSDWEHIIVDDCSQDETVEIVQKQKDSRIRLITLPQNAGAAVARNTGLRIAQGRYIAFLDSDDLWVPHKLETQLNFMRKKDVAFSFSKYRVVREDGLDTGMVVDVPPTIDYKSLLKNTVIGCLTVMLDTHKLGSLQMPNIRSRQDTALWLSILKDGYMAHGIQEELSLYRKVEGSLSSNKLKAAKQTWKLYRDIERLNLPYSLWCFVHYAFNGLRKNIS